MRVYRYTLKPPLREHRDLVETQIRLATEYKRALVKIEHDRRAAIERAFRDHLPAVHAACDEAERACEEAATLFKRARSTKAVLAPKDDLIAAYELKQAKAVFDAAREVEKAAREDKRKARKAAGPALKPVFVATDTAARAEAKRAYNDFGERGLAWGTRLKVAEAVERAAKDSAKEGTLPHFPRASDAGQIAVQLQNGLACEAALGGQDTRLRLEFGVPLSDWLARQGKSPVGKDGRPLPEAKGGGRNRGFVHLRVGSDGRAPVWATWPVHLKGARDLPAGAPIKWAQVSAIRIGDRTEWQICLTVDDGEPEKKEGGETLAVNLGWRNLVDGGGGGIRVAYAVGTDGHEEEVQVPAHFLERIKHVESLRSTRDKMCEQALSSLKSWIDEVDAGDREVTLPDWFRQETEHVALWRGPPRLARFVRQWGERRFDDDESIYTALALWRGGPEARALAGRSVGNRHVRFWESDEREAAYRHRLDEYRKVAKRWADRYARVVFTDMDLRDFSEAPAPEEGPETKGAVQRRTKNLAGPSILRGEVERAVRAAGGTVDKAGGPSTQTCRECGAVERFEARSSVTRACGACGAVDDQDRNHCRVILARSEVTRKGRGALAPSVARTETGGEKVPGGRWQKRRSQKAAQVPEITGGA